MTWTAKRFWAQATVDPEGAGFGVRLDGRPVKTPAKSAFVVPTRALAEAVAAEWQAQGEILDPRSMPVTRAVNAALDKVAVQFDEVAAMLAGYGDSDLLCYRAQAPQALVARQAAAWDPLLDWARATYGARLFTVQGVMHRGQSPDALRKLAAPLSQMTAFELTAMHDLVSLSGSLVIGLAGFTGARPLADLWRASRIDEEWQAEQWGADAEEVAAAEAKRTAFERAGQFLDLLRV